MRKENCWNAISGERLVVPALVAENANQAAVTAAETALAVFVEKDEDSQLVHIRNKRMAKEAWIALREFHERNTLFPVPTTDGSNSSSEWLIDSGAMSHVVNNRHMLMKFDSQHKSKVVVANGGTESLCG